MGSEEKFYDVVDGNRRYLSGYCYLHWFDELAVYNGFSVDDNQLKILVEYLGKFPRIKVVLSVLFMLCIDKTFVFSFPSFNPYKGVYHLGRFSSRKFPLLVLMDYFMTDSVNKIGSDEGLLAREIVSILDLDSKAVVSNAISNKLKTGKDTELCRLIENEMIDMAKSRLARRDKCERLILKMDLTTDEESLLTKQFPELKLEFLGRIKETHGLAHAFRLCEMQVHLKVLGLMFNSESGFRRNKSFDATLVDIGGNYLMHFWRVRKGVHCCNPILGPYDALRHSKKFNELSTAQIPQKFEKEYRSLLYNEDNLYVCNSKAQDCPVTAKFGLCLHSSYDMNANDLVEIMERKNMNVISGSFIFSSEILVKESGVLGDLQVYFRKYSENDEIMIEFGFVGDSSLTYVHKYRNYLSIIETKFIISSTQKTSAFIELTTNRCGVQFFLVTRNLFSFPMGSLSNQIWFKDEGNVVVESWSFDIDRASNLKWLEEVSLECGFGMVRERMIVPKKLVDDLLMYALRISEGKFSVGELYNMACSMNTRTIVNGKDVMTPFRVDAMTLYKLVYAVYVSAYCERFNQGVALKVLLKDIKHLRESKTKGILVNLWRAFCDGRPFGKFSSKSFNETLESGKFPNDNDGSVCVLKKFLSFMCSYQRAFPLDIKNCVKFVSINSVIELDKTYYELDKLLPGIQVGKIKFSDEVVGRILDDSAVRTTINQTLATKGDSVSCSSVSCDIGMVEEVKRPDELLVNDDVVISVGREPSVKVEEKGTKPDAELTYVCKVSGRVVDVPGDGNCFFYSVIAALNLKGYTPSLLRNELLKSKLLEEIVEPVRGELKKILLSETAWGAVELVPLVVDVFGVPVCVHFYDNGEQRAVLIDGPSRAPVHLLHANAHWQYIDDTCGGANIDGMRLMGGDLNLYLLDGRLTFPGVLNNVESLPAVESCDLNNGVEKFDKVEVNLINDETGVIPSVLNSEKDLEVLNESDLSAVLVRNELELDKVLSKTDACSVESYQAEEVDHGYQLIETVEHECKVSCDVVVDGKLSDLSKLSGVSLKAQKPNLKTKILKQKTIKMSEGFLKKKFKKIFERKVPPKKTLKDEYVGLNFDVDSAYDSNSSGSGSLLSLESVGKKVCDKSLNDESDLLERIVGVVNDDLGLSASLKKKEASKYPCVDEVLAAVEEYSYSNDAFQQLRIVNESLESAGLILHFVHNLVGKGYGGFARLVMNDKKNFVSIMDDFKKKNPLGLVCVTEGNKFQKVINVVSSKFLFVEDLRKILRVLKESDNRRIEIHLPAVGMGLWTHRPETVMEVFSEFEFLNIKFVMHVFPNERMLFFKLKNLLEGDAVCPSAPPVYQYWREHRVDSYRVAYEKNVDKSAMARNAAREQKELWRFSELVYTDMHKVFFEKFLAYKDFNLVPKDLIKEMLDSNEGYGLINLETGKFLVRPKFKKKEYMCGFDGTNFVNLKLKGDVVIREDGVNSGLILVSNYTEKMLDTKLFRSCERLNIDEFILPEVSLTQGVPGCGKTTYIINKHKKLKIGEKVIKSSSRISNCDLVLTTTRDAADDLKKKIDALGFSSDRKRYRTVDSYLINDDTSYETVYVDEALMLHPGSVVFVMMKTRCKRMVLLGDRAQIPYINRLTQVDARCTGYDFVDDGEVLSVSYRCPVDVAARLSGFYKDGMKSKNGRKETVRMQRISNLSQVPKLADVKYLVYKQSEKEELRQKGYNVSTIHEFQGEQSKKIFVVRLSNKMAESIYMSKEHALVAISRHTEEFCYYTFVVTDALARLCGKSISEGEYKLHLVGGYEDYYVLKGGYVTVDSNISDFVNVHCDVDRRPLFCEDVFSYGFDFVDNVCERDYGDFASVEKLQWFYDRIFPGNSVHYLDNDPYLVENGDLELAIDSVEIRTSKRGPNCAIYDCKKPVLRTAVANNRRASQVEMLLALIKRNKNVPQLQGLVKTDCLLSLMKQKFLGFFDPGKLGRLDIYGADKLVVSSGCVNDWLVGQGLNVVKELNGDLPVWDYELSKYKYMIKPTVKPQLSLDAPYEYASLQTIAYCEKFINAYFCPKFREIKKRLMTCLNDKFKIFTDCSPKEFEENLNKFCSPNDLLTREVLEIDISKYDKSQGALLLDFEIEVYKMFGLSEYDAELWRNAHVFTKLCDNFDGVYAKVNYQRKSGDAATFLGNTVVLMGVIAVLFDLKKIDLGMFAGDDSLLFGTGFDEDKNFFCANLFNLESKFFFYNKSYFCSKFLLNCEGLWRFVPDPLKILTKLGRRDLVNDEHVEEYRISLVDLVGGYSDVFVDYELTAALIERYEWLELGDIGSLLQCIVGIVNERERFLSLYYNNPGDIVINDPSRPKLE
jgi:hypothetical protein